MELARQVTLAVTVVALAALDLVPGLWAGVAFGFFGVSAVWAMRLRSTGAERSGGDARATSPNSF
jgi:hypothetical protein